MGVSARLKGEQVRPLYGGKDEVGLTPVKRWCLLRFNRMCDTVPEKDQKW